MPFIPVRLLLSGTIVGLLLSLSPTAAPAQRRPPLPVPTRAYTIEDTAHAVRRLFNSFDSRGTAGLARSATVLTGVPVAALLPAPGGHEELKRTILSAGLLSGAVGAGLGLQRMLRFSRRHRDEVVAAYLQGEPLPTYVRRRLRPEHFQAGR